MSERISAVLHRKFTHTTDFIKDNDKLKHLPLSPPTTVSLFLYSRAKQYEVGPCNTDQPSIFNITARLKWNAWEACKLNKWKALHEYFDALRDYILTIDFTRLNEEGRELAEGMLDAVTLDDLQTAFLVSDGTLPDIAVTPPQHADEEAQPHDVGQIEPNHLSTPQIPPSHNSQHASDLKPLSPQFSQQIDPQSPTQSHHSQPQSATTPDIDNQPILTIADVTPTKSSPPIRKHINSAQSLDDHDQPNSPLQIRVGSRSARKSMASKPYIHQTPSKQHTSGSRQYQQYTPQPHQFSNSSSNIPSTSQRPSQSPQYQLPDVLTEYQTPSISPSPSTKEIFIQLQQHAQQSNNKQLLLLLALIDQRETATYLKLNHYKQQQLQHMDVIDSLQYQLHHQQEQQTQLSISFYSLQEELQEMKKQHQEQLSPVVAAVQNHSQKISSLQTQFESFKAYVIEKLQWCTRLLEKKFPTGWLGVRKTFFNIVKFLLRCYTLWDVIITIRDIYDWCCTSRWLYKTVILPSSQYLKR